MNSRDALLEHLGNLFRGVTAHLGEISNFFSNHREAFAVFTGTCGFDRGVEREQLGLKHDIVNNSGFSADFADYSGDFVHLLVTGFDLFQDLAVAALNFFNRVHHAADDFAALIGYFAASDRGLE